METQELALDMSMMRKAAADATEVLRVLANEDRLLLLCQLSQGEKSVSELEELLDIHQPTLSQQLGVLRTIGLVNTRRDGKRIYYSIADEKVLVLLETMYGLYCPNRKKARNEYRLDAFHGDSSAKWRRVDWIGHRVAVAHAWAHRRNQWRRQRLVAQEGERCFLARDVCHWHDRRADRRAFYVWFARGANRCQFTDVGCCRFVRRFWYALWFGLHQRSWCMWTIAPVATVYDSDRSIHGHGICDGVHRASPGGDVRK